MDQNPIYKVVETSTVTAEELETTLNRETAGGWRFESFNFIVRENSRRPSMVFILFTRPHEGGVNLSDKPEPRTQKEVI
jgi:hypothetical protein